MEKILLHILVVIVLFVKELKFEPLLVLDHFFKANISGNHGFPSPMIFHFAIGLVSLICFYCLLLLK